MSRIEKLIIIVALTTILGATIITGYLILKQESKVYKVKYKTFETYTTQPVITMVELNDLNNLELTFDIINTYKNNQINLITMIREEFKGSGIKEISNLIKKAHFNQYDSEVNKFIIIKDSVIVVNLEINQENYYKIKEESNKYQKTYVYDIENSDKILLIGTDYKPILDVKDSFIWSKLTTTVSNPINKSTKQIGENLKPLLNNQLAKLNNKETDTIARYQGYKTINTSRFLEITPIDNLEQMKDISDNLLLETKTQLENKIVVESLEPVENSSQNQKEINKDNPKNQRETPQPEKEVIVDVKEKITENEKEKIDKDINFKSELDLEENKKEDAINRDDLNKIVEKLNQNNLTDVTTQPIENENSEDSNVIYDINDNYDN